MDLQHFFIHLPIEKQLGSFQVSAFMNKVDINIQVQSSVWTWVSTNLDKYQEV